MAQFEQLCAAKKLQLFVLPPKRPHSRSGRARPVNLAIRVLCLPTRLPKFEAEVDRFAYHFNHVRPHQALGDLTLAEYLALCSQRDLPASHASHM